MIIFFRSFIFLLPFSPHLQPNVAMTLAPGWFEKVSAESIFNASVVCALEIELRHLIVLITIKIKG